MSPLYCVNIEFSDQVPNILTMKLMRRKIVTIRARLFEQPPKKASCELTMTINSSQNIHQERHVQFETKDN